MIYSFIQNFREYNRNSEFILYINSKYNYIGELEDFEKEKEISKRESKMEITDTQVKTITIIPGKPYLNDDLRSVEGPEGELIMVLNRLDGKFSYRPALASGMAFVRFYCEIRGV